MADTPAGAAPAGETAPADTAPATAKADAAPVTASAPAAPAPPRPGGGVVLFEKDGWGFYTKGLIAAHYQAIIGDGEPPGNLVGGVFGIPGEDTAATDTSDSRNPKLTVSRLRSGFIGTQIGFGVTRRISDSVDVDSLVAVSLADISNARGTTNGAPQGIDFREAWAALHTPFGTVRFGRMFSLFGSASSEVVLLAYRYAEGNPCLVQGSTIGCGSVGAGPLYPLFEGQIQYLTPRLAGFQVRLAVVDPTSAAQIYTLTPIPRFDGELTYEAKWGDVGKFRVIGQGLYNHIEQQATNGMPGASADVKGLMASALLDVGGSWGLVQLGGGGWAGTGVGFHWLMEAPSGGMLYTSFDGSPQYALRDFRGYYGNLAYDYHGTAIAFGGGGTFLKATEFDKMQMGYDLLSQSLEGHVVFTQRFDSIVLEAEYMRWSSHYLLGETQNLNFMGVGINYFW
jgi:hypothetical protein